MSRAKELIEKCADEVAALCENTGMKLVAIDQNQVLSALAIGFSIASLAADKIERKILSIPGGREFWEKIGRQADEDMAKRPRKLDS